MKKLLAVLSIVMIIIGVSCSNDMNRIPEKVEFSYERSSRGISIDGFRGDLPDGKLVIPSEIEGEPVVGIKGYSFMGRDDMRAIHIPASVDSIEAGVFAGCDALEDIDVDDLNEKYDDEGECLIELENGTLIAGCRKSVIGANGKIKKIGSYAFDTILGIDEVNIPEGVEEIASWAFSDCGNIGEVNLPASLETVGHNIFVHTYVGELNMAEGNALYYTKGNCLIERDTKTLIAGTPTSVIPRGGEVLIISNGAFQNDHALTEIVIPEGVTTLADNAFSDTGLTSINIPASVTSIDSQSLGWNQQLANIKVAEGNAVYTAKDGCLMKGTILVQGTIEGKIPEGTTGIGDSAFIRLRFNEKDIVIPESVKKIGSHAFFGTYCRSLTLHDGIETAGDNAFATCNVMNMPNRLIWNYADYVDPLVSGIIVTGYNGNDVNVVIPSEIDGKTVCALGSDAISGRYDLKSITIPETVESVIGTPFRNLDNIGNIIVEEGNKYLKVAGNMLLYKLPEEKYEVVLSLDNPDFSKVTDPVSSISSYSFMKRTLPESFSIPEGIETIAAGAFDGAKGMKVLTIPDTVTKVGPSILVRNKDIEKIIIDDTEESVKTNWNKDWNEGYAGAIEYLK